ncbi:hypothetical protein EXIGLDRAFT_759385 [Exidia glandulosa HHB12029]|uniref:Uncharacterized protein n=1 Tax=Exidia glandulosa HHB12029 TaxID=1314781 RepID=A0A165Q4T6_EXIGL|nr:hypothetical protein EXIGLDRAFT_759385 [Exidia glandulosa HHB12029]
MSSDLDEKQKLPLADGEDESAPLVADNDNDNETDPPTRRTRFEREHQPPSPWKRAALILFIFALLWFAARLRAQSRPGKPAVVHAERYSKKFKFRPAASPIVTQKLPDGRTRVRGDDVRRIKLAEDKAKKEGKGKKKN